MYPYYTGFSGGNHQWKQVQLVANLNAALFLETTSLFYGIQLSWKTILKKEISSLANQFVLEEVNEL